MDIERLSKWKKYSRNLFGASLEDDTLYLYLEVEDRSNPHSVEQSSHEWEWRVQADDRVLGSGYARTKHKAKRKAARFAIALHEDRARDQRTLLDVRAQVDSLEEERRALLDLLEAYRDQSLELTDHLFLLLEGAGIGVSQGHDLVQKMARMDLKVHHALRNRK